MAALGGTAPFYEKDAALRAYANRVAILAGCLGLVVVVLAAIVLFTRAKPPLIIRIGADGKATVISPDGAPDVDKNLIASVKASQAPTPLEKTTFVTDFVNLYWSYDEHSLPEHWSKAFKMMTGNLARDVYTKMTAEGEVGKLQGEHDKSEITITNMEADEKDPLVFHILATRIEIKSKDGINYTAEKKAESYTIHLVETDRTSRTPSSLLVLSFKRDEITSEPYTIEQQ